MDWSGAPADRQCITDCGRLIPQLRSFLRNRLGTSEARRSLPDTAKRPRRAMRQVVSLCSSVPILRGAADSDSNEARVFQTRDPPCTTK